MLDYTVSHLYNFGIREMVFTLGYRADAVTEWVTGYRDIKCRFSLEDIPLGTAGGVKEAEGLLDDVFIVMSGDALEDIDLAAMAHKHFASKAAITMAVTHVANPSLYGVVEMDGYGTVVGFVEKPQNGESTSNLINCGVYIINKSVLRLVPKGERFDFARDLFPLLLSSGKISAYIHDGYWSDIGDIRSYYQANFDMMRQGGFFPKPFNYNGERYSSYRTGGKYPSLIGSTASLVGHCRSSILGQGARIASGASVDNCIVLDEVVVRSRYLNAVIGEGFALTVPLVQTEGETYSTQYSNIFS